MPEPVSTAVAGYTLALCLARGGSAVSREAQAVRDAASAIVALTERSVALFGAKGSVISRIYEVAAECEHDSWDGEEGVGVSRFVVERSIDFVRAFPDGLASPEVAAEPDGSISFDWIEDRTKVFSVSVGASNRLAFAWIDGTDRGHGVARFDGEAIPARILNGIREITDDRLTPFRAA